MTTRLFFTVCHFPIPRVKTAIKVWMAGLLTDSLPDSFPTLTIYTRSVVKVNIKKLNRVSQQRDCPGFTPDSLLIQIVDMAIWNQFGAKIANLYRNPNECYLFILYTVWFLSDICLFIWCVLSSPAHQTWRIHFGKVFLYVGTGFIIVWLCQPLRSDESRPVAMMPTQEP